MLWRGVLYSVPDGQLLSVFPISRLQSDFRSGKIAKPLTGDAVWSVPTLVTLNPLGAPIAHTGLHVSAVLHSYDTGTFLSPHE